MPRRYRAPSLALFAWVVTGAVGLAAAANEADRVRFQRLEELRGRIVASERNLESARRQARGLAGQLRETRLELQLQSTLLEESRLELQSAQIGISESEARSEGLKVDLQVLREQAGLRLSTLARYGRGGYLRLLMSMETGDGDDPRPALRTLRYFVRRDGQTLKRYLATARDLEEEQARLQVRRSEAAIWLATESERADALRGAQERQQKMLDRALLREADESERQQTLELRVERLESLISLVASRAESNLEGRPIQEFQGALDWPVDGEVVVDFGPRRDPTYGTQVPHNGLAIRCPSVVGREAASARAVYPGRVRYAAPFKGFGDTVIVQHQKRVFTLYAGLDDMKVAEGDVLSLGTVLGTCSPRLYLEFRVGTKAENPRSWLR